MEREKYIKSLGYNLQTTWEHEYLKRLETDPDFQSFEQSVDIPCRLTARTSFAGGRTEAMTLHYKVKDNEQITYVDVTSLYPYCNKYSEYPDGHPTVITSNFKPMSEYFGLAFVDILPPKTLFHPLLPLALNGKLIFGLCFKCMEESSTKQCQCTPKQRTIRSTWTTIEINKAVDVGYVIIKIHEVYHWAKRQCGLFAEYVNTFLKLKQEANGWPKWIKNDDDRKKYINDYLLHEGILFDETQIEHNPAKRTLAKLCLNAFWGKFGQRPNKVKHEFFTKSEQLTKLLLDQTKEIIDFRAIGESFLHIEYANTNDFIEDEGPTNIFIAAFTTSHARLKLYSFLEMVGDRALYCDTDSVIYISKPGHVDLPLGDYLGQLTNELQDGDHIVEFSSAAPKLYSFKTKNGEFVNKCKGFKQNYMNDKILNFESIKDMVINNSTVLTRNDRITRNTNDFTVVNKLESKMCRAIITKRVREKSLEEQNDDYRTYPYGYIHNTII